MSAALPVNRAGRRKASLAWLMRLAVSAIVLVVVFRIVSVERVWSEARQIAPSLWLVSLMLFLAGHAAAAAKWRLLIGRGASFPQAFQAHLAGLAANLCLPGIAGGDVVRAGLLYRRMRDPSRLVVGSVADRMLDMLGLTILGVAGAFAALPPGDPQRAWLGGVALLGAAGLTLLFPAAVALEPRVGGLRSGGKAARLVARGISAMAALAREPRRLALCLAISMAVQATFIGINIALATALHIEAPVAAWFFAWSSAKLVAIAPISLGGLGVREAVMAYLLTPFGADFARVIATGLIWQTVLYAGGLVGLLALVAWKPRDDAATAAPPVRGERTS